MKSISANEVTKSPKGEKIINHKHFFTTPGTCINDEPQMNLFMLSVEKMECNLHFH